MALTETAARLWRPHDTFGARLRLIRYELRLTVEEAAQACGIPHPTWSTWENGVTPRDKVEIVARIVNGLSTTEESLDGNWLLFGGELTPTSTTWSGSDEVGRRRLGVIGQQRMPGIR